MTLEVTWVQCVTQSDDVNNGSSIVENCINSNRIVQCWCGRALGFVFGDRVIHDMMLLWLIFLEFGSREANNGRDGK